MLRANQSEVEIRGQVLVPRLRARIQARMGQARPKAWNRTDNGMAQKQPGEGTGLESSLCQENKSRESSPNIPIQSPQSLQEAVRCDSRVARQQDCRAKEPLCNLWRSSGKVRACFGSQPQHRQGARPSLLPMQHRAAQDGAGHRMDTQGGGVSCKAW